MNMYVEQRMITFATVNEIIGVFFTVMQEVKGLIISLGLKL